MHLLTSLLPNAICKSYLAMCRRMRKMPRLRGAGQQAKPGQNQTTHLLPALSGGSRLPLRGLGSPRMVAPKGQKEGGPCAVCFATSKQACLSCSSCLPHSCAWLSKLAFVLTTVASLVCVKHPASLVCWVQRTAQNWDKSRATSLLSATRPCNCC